MIFLCSREFKKSQEVQYERMTEVVLSPYLTTAHSVFKDSVNSRFSKFLKQNRCKKIFLGSSHAHSGTDFDTKRSVIKWATNVIKKDFVQKYFVLLEIQTIIKALPWKISLIDGVSAKCNQNNINSFRF